MNFDLYVIALSDKGVQVALEDGSPAFWLPRNGSITWRGTMAPGEMVSADIPRWLAAKHAQLVASRTSTQQVLGLHEVGLDPEKARKELPMTNDRPADAGAGSLKRNAKKERPSQPDYLGSIEIRGVGRYWLSGWINEDKETGAKWLKLAVREAEEKPIKPQQAAGGPDFGEGAVPFALEAR